MSHDVIPLAEDSSPDAATPGAIEGPMGPERAGFAARLREATKRVHREAERSGFVADLIRGRATRQGYAIYLRNLVPVYARLEERLGALDRPSPLAAAFCDPALRRLPSLVSDLSAIVGGHWDRTCPVLPQAEMYTGAIAAADESRLVAHAYARYLGDLSGGQILRPLLTRSLGLGPEALALYVFPDVGDVDTAKRAMRQALDTVPPDGAIADAIVAEAIAAFRHNIDLASALAAVLQALPSET